MDGVDEEMEVRMDQASNVAEWPSKVLNRDAVLCYSRTAMGLRRCLLCKWKLWATHQEPPGTKLFSQDSAPRGPMATVRDERMAPSSNSTK